MVRRFAFNLRGLSWVLIHSFQQVQTSINRLFGGWRGIVKSRVATTLISNIFANERVRPTHSNKQQQPGGKEVEGFPPPSQFHLLAGSSVCIPSFVHLISCVLFKPFLFFPAALCVAPTEAALLLFRCCYTYRVESCGGSCSKFWVLLMCQCNATPQLNLNIT